jgi:hypothetical protein
LNALVPPRIPRLPGAIQEPVLDDELALLVERLLADRSALRRPDVLQWHHVVAAETALPKLERACLPLASACSDLVAIWLRELNGGAVYQLPANALTQMHAAVLRGSGDLPGVAFNVETLAIATRTVERLSAVKIDEVVRPAGRILTSKRDILASIIDVGRKSLRPETGTELPQEHRDAVLAKFRQEMSHVQETRERSANTPRGTKKDNPHYFTDAQMLTNYENLSKQHDNNQGANVTRAGGLRRMLDGDR